MSAKKEISKGSKTLIGELLEKGIYPDGNSKEINPIRAARTINCKSCDCKLHYRYTREELVDRFYRPNGPAIKPCISDHCMDVIWLNYKLEDTLE